MAPLGRIAYLYVGSADVGRDLAYYRDALGAEVVWDLTGFGARVAAVRVVEGPLVLLADHREAPSAMPVVEVAHLAATEQELRARGWTPAGAGFEIPNGPCLRFDDPSGNPWAVFENVRPEPFAEEAPEP